MTAIADAGNVDSMSKEDHSMSSSGPRETLIVTAVRFLTNANVINRPLEHKRNFLKKKGLTDEEIRISCERAGAYDTNSLPQQTIVPLHLEQHQALYSPPSVWVRIRDIVHTLALLGGIGYAIYWVYKTYVEPFLFGSKKPKPKSTQESISDLEKAVAEVSRCTEEISKSTTELHSEIRSELSRLSTERETSTSTRKLLELKGDIAVVKGLLLSRQQFPSAPAVSGLRSSTKPSIPAWQMDSSPSDIDQDRDMGVQAEDHCEQQNGDTVSCSQNGSGTGEAAAANGSDSSLEMIQEEQEASLAVK